MVKEKRNLISNFIFGVWFLLANNFDDPLENKKESVQPTYACAFFFFFFSNQLFTHSLRPSLINVT